MSALDLVAARARKVAARERLTGDIDAFKARAAPRAIGTRIATRVIERGRRHPETLAGLGTGVALAVIVPATLRLLAAGMRRLRRRRTTTEPIGHGRVLGTETASAMEGRAI